MSEVRVLQANCLFKKGHIVLKGNKDFIKARTRTGAAHLEENVPARELYSDECDAKQTPVSAVL